MLSKTSCEKEDRFPVLVNSDSGSFQLSVICVLATDNDRYLLMFTSSTELDDASSKDPNIGIAFPLKSGRFLVMRFSMAGSKKASDHMKTLMLNDKKSTKDTLL